MVVDPSPEDQPLEAQKTASEEASSDAVPSNAPDTVSKAPQQSSLSNTDDSNLEIQEPNVVYSLPISKDRPDKSVLVAMVNPTVMQALAQNTPDKVLQFAEASDNRQFQYYAESEDNRHKERIGSENTRRIAIGTIGLTVVAVLIYSAATGDTSLSETIIIALISGFGGLGLKTLLSSPPDED